MTQPIRDPFARLPAAPFEPAGRRTLRVFGAEVELLWLPERRHRRGRPIELRPALAPDYGDRIVAEEATSSADGVAITANRHPFAARQVILWRDEFVRDPDATLLRAGAAFTAQGHGTLLVNTIGAAASIVRAHGHLVGEPFSFLATLRCEPVTLKAFEPPLGVRIERAAAPFPILMLRIHGAAEERIATALDCARRRTTPAFNLIDDGRSIWFCPRPLEVPAPFFPQALGSAELCGRWCWDDEAAFRAATREDLEAALRIAGVPREAGL